MTGKLKMYIVIILILYVLVILREVKKKKMHINYLIFWSIMGIGLIIALLVPNLVENITKLLGFELPVNMIYSCAIFIILYLIFDLTKLITKEQNQNILLIQEISILKKKIEELDNENKRKIDERI